LERGKREKSQAGFHGFLRAVVCFHRKFLCTLDDPFLELDKLLFLTPAVKLNGLWDITIFSRNLNLKYRIGYGILFVFL
jgi:hypothetical protein